MLRLHLLGELWAEVDGTRVELPRAWHARGLLAWLALNPGEHLRSDVAARFWPDVLDASARASLRNALWALRRALGPSAREALVTSRERVGLSAGDGVWTDVAEVERLESEGSLEDALALCHGELLADFEEEWALDERELHRERVSAILAQLASQAESGGDPRRALELAKRRASLDRLAEEPQRELIRLQALAGDSATAVSTYARFCDRLRTEIGISPSRATRDLVERLRASDLQASEPETEKVARPESRPGTATRFALKRREDSKAHLVGRDAEISTLSDGLSQVADGDGSRAIAIAGEAGVGKTRLAAELASRAGAGTAIVLAGAAHEDGVGLQQPFSEALARYAASATPGERDRLLAPRALALEPLLPGLADPAAPEPPAGTPSGGRRYAMLDAFSSLIAEISAQAPVLVLLDDLQWADATTAAMLRHLLEPRGTERLLVVGTLRSEDLDPAAAITAALIHLESRGLLQRLELGGLSRNATAALASATAGHDLFEQQLRVLHAETDGNPLLVGELVRSVAPSDWERSEEPFATSVPDAVRYAVARRMARLSEPCARLLTVASVLGRMLDPAVLEQISDLDGDRFWAALDEAVRAGVLSETGTEADSLAFPHALIQRAIRDRTTRASRRRIHARIAEALEREGREGEGLERVAHHLLEAGPAGDPGRAVALADRAAESSIARLAYAEAVDLLSRALELLPPGDPGRRRLAMRRALAYQALTHELLTDAPRPVATAVGAGGSDPDQSLISSGRMSPTIS